jgi:hypothetical protein
MLLLRLEKYQKQRPAQDSKRTEAINEEETDGRIQERGQTTRARNTIAGYNAQQCCQGDKIILQLRIRARVPVQLRYQGLGTQEASHGQSDRAL